MASADFSRHIEFAVSRVRMLLDFGIIPYLVFDGDALPSKAGTNKERKKRRDESRALGLELLKAGKIPQAHQELQKAAAVTPQMARQLIEELKRLNVPYIVAPYEADAQLAYLEQQGIINGILSEDSDLLVFGAKRLITKLNQYGECVEIERADFSSCKEISLAGWTDAMFRRMAILSGCDYLPNIDKMGLKTAYRFVRKHREAEKVIRMIQFEGKFHVPVGYFERFQQAELTFLHHRVFCPTGKKMVFSNELPHGLRPEDMPYLGTYVDEATIVGVACGDLNPRSKEPISLKLAKPPLRPSLSENGRKSLSNTTDLKKKLSLDNFFKPYRQPLAELDPNSLTPSPSQQRLLERNRDASWEPRLVSSAPQLRRSAGSDVGSSRAPQNTFLRNTDRTSFLAKAATKSAFQPPKRQRLCSETDESSPADSVQHSPFFAEAGPRSPLAQKKTRERKKKRGIEIWSDDSIDGILLGLPDIQQLASPETKTAAPLSVGIATNADECQLEFDLVPQSSPVLPSQSSSDEPPEDTLTPEDKLVTSAEVSQILQPVAVDQDEDPDAFEDLLEYHVRKQNEALLKTFLFQSPATQAEALKSLDTKKPIITQSVKEKKQATTCPIPTECKMTDSTILPKAFASTSDLSKTFAFQTSEQQANALESLKRLQSPDTGVNLGRNAVRNPWVPMSPRQYVFVGGSEDKVPSDSEEERSDVDPEGIAPKVGLSAFLFSLK